MRRERRFSQGLDANPEAAGRRPGDDGCRLRSAARGAARSRPHDPRDPVYRRADRDVVLDIVAVSAGDHLGDDTRRRDLADHAAGAAPAVEPTAVSRRGDDLGAAVGLRRAVLARGRDNRPEFRHPRRLGSRDRGIPFAGKAACLARPAAAVRQSDRCAVAEGRGERHRRTRGQGRTLCGRGGRLVCRRLGRSQYHDRATAFDTGHRRDPLCRRRPRRSDRRAFRASAGGGAWTRSGAARRSGDPQRGARRHRYRIGTVDHDRRRLSRRRRPASRRC